MLSHSSIKSWEIRILWSGQTSEMSSCCPTESKQIPQVNFSPERRSQQREETSERVAPTAYHAQKAHQDVEQQRRPDLPADRVGAVAQEIAQLQALLDLLKEHFDLPAATIQISHTAGAPREIIGQELHLAFLTVDLHQSPDPPHARPDARNPHRRGQR